MNLLTLLKRAGVKRKDMPKILARLTPAREKEIVRSAGKLAWGSPRIREWLRKTHRGMPRVSGGETMRLTSFRGLFASFLAIVVIAAIVAYFDNSSTTRPDASKARSSSRDSSSPAQEAREQGTSRG
jgi:hypothetical protein